MQVSNPAQFQRNFQEPPLLNNNTFGSNGVHIHSVIDAPNIKDVWEDNFEKEFKTIMQLAEKYKVVAMDTEFPGIVYKLGESELSTVSGYHEIEYKTIKMNVDKLKVIQVGISIADEDGYMPPGIGTWQFNIKFDLNTDDYLKESIEMLSEAGIQFDKLSTKGIDPQLFSEYLMASGLVLNEDIKWITFHGGFDFGYLLRMLCGTDLPEEDTGFSNLLNIYFPCFYDVKIMTKEVESLKFGSLAKLSNELRVRRVGPQHQAGSDAMLTLAVYFKLKSTYLKGVSEQKHANILYGIGLHGMEASSDYIWQNFITPDYPYVMFQGFGMNNMNSMMNSNYYSQNEVLYNNVGTNQYNMPYNVYNAFGTNAYMEPTQKTKKFGK